MKRRLAATLAVLALALATPLIAWLALPATSARAGDQTTIGSNRLGAGVLDVEIDSTNTALFTVSNMAPGDAVTGTLQVRNSGTLPLEATIWLRSDDPRIPLFELTIAPGADCTNAPAGSSIATEPPAADTIRLASGAESAYCLRATLPLTAPNSAQGVDATFEIVVDAVHDIAASEAS